MTGTGRRKGKTRQKGGSVQKKLTTRCFDCNRPGHWSGDPIETRCAGTFLRVAHWRRRHTLAGRCFVKIVSSLEQLILQFARWLTPFQFSIHEACAVMRVSVVPGKLMLIV